MNEIIRMGFYNTQTAGRISYTGDDGDAPYDCHNLSKREPGNLTKYCLVVRWQACAVQYTCPINGTCTTANQLKMGQYFACAEGAAMKSVGHTCFNDNVVCANALDMDVEGITSCFNPENVSYNSEPATLIADISNFTAVQTPEVATFPDLRAGTPIHRIPRKHPDIPSLITAVCAAYKGPSKPAACTQP